jgi:hypothetical protein
VTSVVSMIIVTLLFEVYFFAYKGLFRNYDQRNTGMIRRTEFIEILSRMGLYILEKGKVFETAAHGLGSDEESLRSVCLSVHLSVCLSVCLSICLSVFLSFRVFFKPVAITERFKSCKWKGSRVRVLAG